MAQLEDLIAATERFHKALGAEIEARATLTGLTRAWQRRELPDTAIQVIEERVAELIPDGKFTATVSLHTLLSALEDAWRAGNLHGRQAEAEGEYLDV